MIYLFVNSPYNKQLKAFKAIKQILNIIKKISDKFFDF